MISESFLTPRRHLQTIRLITDFVIRHFIVNIGIRTRTIRWVLTACRATCPQICGSFSAFDASDGLLVKTAAGISALPPEH